MIQIKDQKSKDELFKKYIQSGHSVGEVSLFAIANETNQKKDVINDVLGIVYKGDIFLMKGTTNVGKYYTYNPLNRKGAFHLAFGYHSKIWRIGKHKKKYTALVNTWDCNKTKGWRDSNQNFKYDKDADYIANGHYGVNLHRMSSNHATAKIGTYSAGCQVVQDPNDFEKLIGMVTTSKMYLNTPLPTYFSYYLFKKEELLNLYKKVYR